MDERTALRMKTLRHMETLFFGQIEERRNFSRVNSNVKFPNVGRTAFTDGSYFTANESPGNFQRNFSLWSPFSVKLCVSRKEAFLTPPFPSPSPFARGFTTSCVVARDIWNLFLWIRQRTLDLRRVRKRQVRNFCTVQQHCNKEC